MDDREALRIRLREKLNTKRSLRGNVGRHNAESHRSSVEKIALDAVGDDAQALGVLMDVIKRPREFASHKRSLCEPTDYDYEEAPPPSSS